MKIEKATIIRVVLFLLAIINFVLERTGHGILPIDSETAAETVSDIAVGIMSLWCAWKNNSFTQEAIMADKYMHELKAARTQKEYEDEELLE